MKLIMLSIKLHNYHKPSVANASNDTLCAKRLLFTLLIRGFTDSLRSTYLFISNMCIVLCHSIFPFVNEYDYFGKHNLNRTH